MMYEYWLATIAGIPDSMKKKLILAYGSGRDVYEQFEESFFEGESEKYKEAMKWARRKDVQKLQEEYEKCTGAGIRFIPWFHEEYPEKLWVLPDHPYALYVKGKLPDPKIPSVAIVGARHCSEYGEELALYYGKDLAKAGFQVISGMARGIDGAGQRGALNGEGTSFAVLGSGPDVCYPREHIGLYHDILKNGGILSEYPPGTKSLAWHFPARNRIISALSEIVIVIEAKEKSGSLITADFALEQGKEVFALPGPVTSPLSQGCHQLIRQGAGILISTETLLQDIGIIHEISSKKKKVLETEENMLYSLIDFVPKSLSQLISESGLQAKEVVEQLIFLELDGKIREVSKNHYVRCGLKPA